MLVTEHKITRRKHAVVKFNNDPVLCQPPAPKCFEFAPCQPDRSASAGDGLAAGQELRNYTVSQKKHVTTFSTITLTISVRLQ